jgi:hypothetical protein
MIFLPRDIPDEMKEWPRQWNGKFTPEGRETLAALEEIWRTVEAAGGDNSVLENCLRTLWILGFEHCRDFLVDRRLPKEVPLGRRIATTIEEGGPLLFGFYAQSDTERFELGCQQIELALRRANAWTTLAALLQ